MTSQKKIAANRQNATRSTGPRTASGKARSRTNALRHGILSQALPSAEHAASMDELARRIAREHGKPENAIEAKIVAETEMTILKTRTDRATLTIIICPMPIARFSCWRSIDMNKEQFCADRTHSDRFVSLTVLH
jgi:hypothetical protein